MANTAQKLHQPDNTPPSSLNWKENPAAKKLLDALVLTIAEEYVEKAKQNPEIFSKTNSQ